MILLRKTLDIAWDLCDFHKLLVCCVNLIYRNLVNCQLQEQVHNLSCSPLFSLPLFNFFIKFPFSCFQLIYGLYRWNLNICWHNYLCQECLSSLLPLSSPKRCKLAETICISLNCIEICLKTPNAQFELKNTFLLLGCKQAKTRCFQQNRNTICVKTLNPAKTQCSQ